MDEQNLNNSTQTGNGLINKRNIFILLGVFILIEVLWAGWTIFQTNKQINQSVLRVTSEPQPTTIELQSNKTSVNVGEQVTVSINVVSEKATDGIDLIINYDPNLLSVVKTPEGSAVILGSLYSEYPLNEVLEEEGKITVSGISSQDAGVTPNGVFGSIVFDGKAPGQASVSLEFTPLSTVDTNVIEKGTSQDILESVKNVTVNINP